jgi:two-component system, LuxR family, response regulator FixJ
LAEKLALSAVRSRPDQIVYVVDDHGEMRKSLHFLLSSLAYQTRSFGSGEEFLNLQPELQPGPILLDMRMPGLDGFEVLAELATRRVAWPVVLMTGHGDMAVAVRALKLGVVEFLEKPFDTATLEAALANAFRCRQTARQTPVVRA